jgi:hypothetical protein
MSEAPDPPFEGDDFPEQSAPDTFTQRLLQIRREVAHAADYMCLACGTTVYEAESLYMVRLPDVDSPSRYTVHDFGVRCSDCCPKSAQYPAMEIIPPDETDGDVYTAESPVGIAAVDPEYLGPIRPTEADDPWNTLQEADSPSEEPVVAFDPETGESELLDSPQPADDGQDASGPSVSGQPQPSSNGAGKPGRAAPRDVDDVTWVSDLLPRKSKSTAGSKSSGGRKPGAPIDGRGRTAVSEAEAPESPSGTSTNKSLVWRVLPTLLKVFAGMVLGALLLVGVAFLY